MLELRNMTKVYPAAGEDVHALRGINLTFRRSEFVAILGPSGCGKTTMLNMIGGLDRFTDGDLIINGRSTKEYKDRDWDGYRNHSVGFVFQSYNLIPHQSVLQNVELALTLSGVGKKERRQRAKAALEKVGLKDQMKKRPGEMSGGQMQRVAIARAIVNDPDIVLADEPTGALDSETSLQVMDILKEISRDRLVIMVTHNPDLAQKYATRIVNMLDGRITGDSMPLTEEEMKDGASYEEDDRKKRPSMSLFTSFTLSLKNLFTKRGRTILTSFAGSIGIIGIALIYAVSQGTTMFIDAVQEETLSGYPITIQAETLDMSGLLTLFMGKAQSEGEHANDAVYEKAVIYELMNAMNSMDTEKNDLRSFRKYIEEQRADAESPLAGALSAVQYGYDMKLTLLTKNVDGSVIECDAQQLTIDIMRKYAGMDMSSMIALRDQTVMGASSEMMSQSFTLWNELIPGEHGEPVSEVIKRQYDVVCGRWPKDYDEVVLFVDRKNEMGDVALYALGLLSEDEIGVLMDAALQQTTVDHEVRRWSFDEILSREFKVMLPTDRWQYDEASGTYTDLMATPSGKRFLYDSAETIRVVGIVRPGEDAIAAQNTMGLGYTSLLTQHAIRKQRENPVVTAQLASPDTDIFTGLPFKSGTGSMSREDKAEAFRSYAAGLNEAEKADMCREIMCTPTDDMIRDMTMSAIGSMSREELESMILTGISQETGMDEASVKGYLSMMSDEDLIALVSEGAKQQYAEMYAQQMREQIKDVPEAQLAAMLDRNVKKYSDEECAAYCDRFLAFSDSTYEKNLLRLGVVDEDSPSTVNLYAVSFEDKDTIEEAIAEYNRMVDDVHEISYTDYVGIMMSSVTTIINAITYVLIAFVSVSLIVSSIMIGVITLISVQERTKEIGILRAIGASKKNVSSLFNAETVIIGFFAGAIGVGVTYLLCIPINLILHSLTGLNNLSAYLPPNVALMLVAISVVLTMIAGVIPSRSAARKDPVVALRTE